MTGTINSVGNSLTGSTGTGAFAGQDSPSFTTTITTPQVIFSGNTGLIDQNTNEILSLNPIASAVNNLEIQNAATTGAPVLLAVGSDTNIGLKIQAKGTGQPSFSDPSGNVILSGAHVGSAVNFITATNSATGNPPLISAIGTDTNISLTINSKGTGGVNIKGTTANNNAASGYVGEIISSQVPLGSAVSLTASTPANVTSISLTAGDYIVFGSVYIQNATGSLTFAAACSSETSATFPDQSLYASINYALAAVPNQTLTIPTQRFKLGSPTTVYLCANAGTGLGALSACGFIQALRIR